MNRVFISFFIFIITTISINAQNLLPQVVSGSIDRYEHFQSRFVTARNIDIWLPDGYSDSIKYAVLYMHDGQMLYDPSQSWNKQSWNVDDVASVLLSQDKVKNFIIVGIWNDSYTRHQDYFPQKPFERLSRIEKDTVVAQLQRAGRTAEKFQPQSDKYLKFLIKELKPYIDSKYSVFTDRENTLMAGSSMGGLISLYAICEYPKVFGGVACLSTHWIGTFTLENNPVPKSLMKYLSKKLPNPKNHHIYFDCGDQTLDAMYPSYQLKIDKIMKVNGYNNDNWVTKYFPGADHSEDAWSNRVEIPLKFLLAR